MENNNVKVQATPSHCTEQKEEILLGEFRKGNKTTKVLSNFDCTKQNSEVFSDIPTFRCYSDCKGSIYIKTDNFREYRIINVVERSVLSSRILDVTKLEGIKPIDIPKFTLGLDRKHALMGYNHVRYDVKNINKQVDYFREAVLPSAIKINNKKVKGTIDMLVDALKLDVYKNYCVDDLATYFNDRSLSGCYYTSISCNSRVLEEEVEFINILSNYFLQNNMFTYTSFVNMFVFFVQNVPEFLETFSLLDLKALYAGDRANIGANYNAINKEVEKALNKIKQERNCENVSMEEEELEEPIDIEQRDIKIFYPTCNGEYNIQVFNKININTITEDFVSVILTKNDMCKLEDLVDAKRDINRKVMIVSTQVRDINDNTLCYAEVELDFSKTHLFQYCEKSGAILAKEDIDKEVYIPVLRN